MDNSKKKKTSKKKPVKARQQVKLTGKALQKFIREQVIEKDKLPDDYKYGAYDGSDPKFG